MNNSLKWHMVDSNQHTAFHEKYQVVVIPFGLLPRWLILKEGTIIADSRATGHPYITTDFNKELATKVAAERALRKIIQSDLPA